MLNFSDDLRQVYLAQCRDLAAPVALKMVDLNVTPEGQVRAPLSSSVFAARRCNAQGAAFALDTSCKQAKLQMSRWASGCASSAQKA